MGCEIKRVALDFEWPLNTTWKGYLNDRANLSIPCPDCDGSGDSALAHLLHAQWYGNAPFSPEDRGSVPLQPRDEAVWAFAQRNVARDPGYYGQGEAAILREAERLCGHWNKQWSHHLNADDVAALIADDRLVELTHDWTREKGWHPKSPMPDITPAVVNTWHILSMGHDSINAWRCIKAECARRGHAWMCSTCSGETVIWPSADMRAHYESWERTHPPEGEGYQLWETVSEGSPQSPVFDTPEGLAVWLATHRKEDKLTVDGWLTFMREGGWAPTMVIKTSPVHTETLVGAAAVVHLSQEEETAPAL